MYKQRAFFFILLFSVCLVSRYFSQNISINTPSIGGCAPLTATYSAPSGAVGSWNFGNSSNSSNPSGVVNYISPGTYTATYSGTNGGTPVNFTVIVYAYPKPVAGFSMALPTSSCAVRSVTLTDQSTTSSTISSWSWNYGDGGSGSSGGTHSYGYTLPGNYSITLQVTDIYGCTSQTTQGTVVVFATPTAVINSNPGSLFSCSPPFTAAFSAGSSTLSNLTYSWNFGNSQTSVAQVPGNITYSTQGTYTVSLTVTSNNCSSTATRQVVVNPTTLTATFPPTVCANAPFTVTMQANQATTSWSLGGGVIANGVPASNAPTSYSNLPVFTNTGVVTVTISAGAPPCLATITRTVYVEKVTAQFAATPPANACSPTMQATYNNQSSPNASTFIWSYPTWQQDTLVFTNVGANPTFTFVQNSLNPYTIYNAPYSPLYAPSVTLIAISAAGCSDTIAHVFDSITRPIAAFYKSKQEGCVPLVVTLKDTSSVFPFNPIVSYTWCNGANPASFATGTGSVVAPQTFTYNTAGTYSPYLIIQTAQGCLDTSFIDRIYAATPPPLSFNVAQANQTVCPTTTVQIINTTAPSVSVNVHHWHVTSDDGFFSGCVGDPNPTWQFTHIGPHSFTMSGYVHGCEGTSVSASTIFVAGPIVTGRYITNCTNRLSVDFESELQDVQTATLNFGDGSPPYVITGTPGSIVSDLTTHVYTLTGDYTATLTGVNAATGCQPSVKTMTVTVRDVQASISSPSVSCVNVSTMFNGSGSVDVLTGCSRGYVWYVDNIPPVDTTLNTFGPIFTTPGTHTVILMVKDANSCSDTATRVVRISKVTPLFTFSTPSICVNSSVQIVNTSTTTAPDNVVSYLWSFGDSQTQVTTSTGTLSHTYGGTGVNSPSTTIYALLTASNSVGCVATYSQPIVIVKPNTTFYASQYNICLGPTTVSFIAQGNNASYTLNVAAGASVVSTSSVMSYNFSNAGSYVISLTARDLNGCESTGSPISILAQQTPTADFTFTSDNNNGTGNVICAPGGLKFYDASQPTQQYYYNWNLGTPNPVISASMVSTSYPANMNGQIPISLTVTTSNGCQSSQTKTFSVYSPHADINADKTVICLGDAIKFNITDTSGTGVYAWTWDFKDGAGESATSSSSNPSFTLHTFGTYHDSGNVNVNLVYYSSQRTCTFSVEKAITVIKIDSDFKRNSELTKIDSVHCVNVLDHFYNTSPGTTTSSWNFGDGGTSSLQQPSYTYANAGVYQVSLTVQGGASGCRGVTVKNMTINPLPVAHISSPDSVCRDASVTLTGSGTSSAGIVGYQWRPAGSVADSLSSPTTVTPSVSTNYSLLVIDGNGCISPPTVQHIYVQQPPPTIQWDTTVIVGQHVPMNTNTGPNFSYTWTPATDLSCLNCGYPLSTSTVNVTYSVQVADNLGCFRVVSTYSIFIDPQTSVDVPTAFTPNGDGVNDVIYVDGWGIKKLNYFRIYNRWGQLLFESNDIKTGWDGNYNGVPQNMETYVYQVSVETYLNQKDLLKTSSFKLIR